MAGRALRILLVFMLGAGTAYAHSSELEPGAAGVPGSDGVGAEGTCGACHAGAAGELPAGRIELTGLPERYLPGARYALSFGIQHPDADRLRWGFVVTAVASQTLLGAGHLRVTDRRNTQTVRGPAGREYLAHTYAGTAIGRQGGQRWSFEWVAPLVAVGEVAFFVAGVAADADGSEAGDLVYSGTPFVVVPGPLPEPETPAPLTPLKIE